MKTIPLTRGYFTKVDLEDFERFSKFNWYVNFSREGSARVAREVNGGPVFLHREILGAKPGEFVDHRDLDGLNNTRRNLRKCTRSQNGANKNKQKDNKSGFKGVSWDADREKWFTKIEFQRKQIALGRFDDLIEAAKAYDAAAVKYFGEFARLNFPA